MSTEYNTSNNLWQNIKNKAYIAATVVTMFAASVLADEKSHLNRYFDLFTEQDSLSVSYKGHGSKYLGIFTVEGIAELYLCPDSATAKLHLDPKSYYSGLDMEVTAHLFHTPDESGTPQLEYILITEKYDNHKTDEGYKKVENVALWAGFDSSLTFHQKMQKDTSTACSSIETGNIDPNHYPLITPFEFYRFLTDPDTSKTIQVYLGGELRDFNVERHGGEFKIPFEPVGWQNDVEYIIIKDDHIEDIGETFYLKEFKVSTRNGEPKFELKREDD